MQLGPDSNPAQSHYARNGFKVLCPNNYNKHKEVTPGHGVVLTFHYQSAISSKVRI